MGGSVRIARVEDFERRHEENVQVQHYGPVLDVIQIVLNPFLEHFLIADFSTQAIYLSPSRDAGLDPMSSKIAVYNRFPRAIFGMGVNRMRAGAYQ